jgi:ABC-2 type transport system permease protein
VRLAAITAPARAALAVAGHELRGYARAPAAWGIATLFLAVQGIGFAGQVSALSNPKRPAPLGAVLEGFFAGNLLTWSLGLAVIALVAMRALAEHRRAGTWETTLTAPVGEAEVIVGKWIAGSLYHAALWVPTALYLVVVARYRPDGASWDTGPVVGAYLAVVGFGAALLAVAMAAAAFTPEPLTAGGVAYAALLLLFLVGELGSLAPGFAADHPTMAGVLDAVSVRARIADLARGEVTLAAVALAVGLAAVGLSLATAAAGLGRRRARDVWARVLATALVAIIAVELGAAARRWPGALDLTARRANTIEPATLAALARIDGPVQLTIVRPTLGGLEPIFAEAERVSRRIAAADPRVRVRVLDPATTAGGLPAIVRESGLAANDLAASGAIAVEASGRHRVIDLFDLAAFAPGQGAAPGRDVAPVVTRLSVESELVARLHELADDRPLVACHTTGHGELGMAVDPTTAELSALADRLRGDGGRLEPLETVAVGVPPACSVLIVGGPIAPLAGAEAMAVEAYLAGGGGLVLLAAVRPDGGELPPTGLEPVVEPYGIAIQDAVAVDPSLALDTPGTFRAIDTYGDAGPAAVIADGFAKRRATVWLVPRALTLSAPAVALVSTTAAGWGERGWREPPPAKDAGDVRGPVAFAAASERGAGRVVVIGSAESLSSAVAPGASAADLFAARALRWAAHRDQPRVELPDKTPEQIRLVMTSGERNAVIALCTGGVPLAFGGLGALLAWRRRRAGRAGERAETERAA